MLFTRLDLDPNEKIVYELRKHWFALVGHLVATFALLLVPLVLYVVGLAFLPTRFVERITEYFYLTSFLYSLWFLVVWVLLFIKWTNYYLDVWYITDRRIIDIEQKGIFHREVSNLRFDKIQDISIEVQGVIATFFKFGDLRVQTAAENSKDFIMKNAARPEEVRKVIFQMHNIQGGSQDAAV